MWWNGHYSVSVIEIKRHKTQTRIKMPSTGSSFKHPHKILKICEIDKGGHNVLIFTLNLLLRDSITLAIRINKRQYKKIELNGNTKSALFFNHAMRS